MAVCSQACTQKHTVSYLRCPRGEAANQSIRKLWALGECFWSLLFSQQIWHNLRTSSLTVWLWKPGVHRVLLVIWEKGTRAPKAQCPHYVLNALRRFPEGPGQIQAFRQSVGHVRAIVPLKRWLQRPTDLASLPRKSVLIWEPQVTGRVPRTSSGHK